MAAPTPARSSSPFSQASHPKRRNTSDGCASSLRNSCEACAGSKVKCSGTKPTCTRCETRGFHCEYLEAKRAGRKPAASTSAGNNNGRVASQPGSEKRASNPSTSTSDAAYASPRGTASELSDIWNDLTPFDRSLFAGISNNDGTSSGFTPSLPMELPALDEIAPIAPMTATDGVNPSLVEDRRNASLPDLTSVAFDAENSNTADLFAFPVPTPVNGMVTPMTGDSRSGQPSPMTTAPCACLIQALALLKRLTSSAPSSGSPGSVSNDDDKIRAIQVVLQQNKSAVETATGMLACPGRHDGYLLVVVCLIAFKALDHFAIILAGTLGPQGAQGRRLSVVAPSNPGPVETCSVEGYRLDSKDWVRQSSQAILAELHSVRSMTRLLAEKLHAQTAVMDSISTGATFSTGTATPDVAGDLWSPSKDVVRPASDPSLPLSTMVYRQLEVDLENRVKALSQQILGRLRHF